MKTTLITVHGNVQGVGFRQNIKSAADSRGLAGYASNQKDGTVEIALQGGERQVREMIDMIKTSPAYADVEQVSVQEEDMGSFNGFGVRSDVAHTQTSRYEARSDGGQT